MTDREIDDLAEELLKDSVELRNFINEALSDLDHDDEYIDGLVDELQSSKIDLIAFIILATEEN